MEDFELGSDGKPQLITLTADEVPVKYVGKKAYKLKPGTHGEKPVYQHFYKTLLISVSAPAMLSLKILMVMAKLIMAVHHYQITEISM